MLVFLDSGFGNIIEILSAPITFYQSAKKKNISVETEEIFLKHVLEVLNISLKQIREVKGRDLEKPSNDAGMKKFLDYLFGCGGGSKNIVTIET